MTDNSLKVEMALERKELAKRFQRLPRSFSTMLDSDIWLDIGRHQDLKMSATKPEVEITKE